MSKITGRKARYSQFCRSGYTPLHLQPWWLDAVCGETEHWEVAIATGRNGDVVGAMPYFIRRRWGLRVIQLPPFTSYAGPLLRYPEQPPAKDKHLLGFEHQTFAQLIGQLPGVAYFVQNFRPEIHNWLPFYWAGFSQTVRYTYFLPGASDTGALYAGLKNTLRTDLKTAARHTIVRMEDDPALLFHLNRQSYARKGLRQPYNFEAFQRLYTTLAGRRQSVGFIARDKQSGAPHAGLYLAFDERQAQVLLTGFDPVLGGSSRALHGLYWEAVRFCNEHNLGLDFEGSMDRGVGHVFRAFGGQIAPYFQVKKVWNPIKKFKQTQ